MCLGTKWNKESSWKRVNHILTTWGKKMFCKKCGTAVDGVVLFCSFYGCKIYSNYNEHPPSTGDEKEIISYCFMKGYK